MPSTITPEQTDAIAAYLKDRCIPSGLGTKEAACSVAAINLSLTGKLTDEIPECMSRVIGRWIIRTQDAMPEDLRNRDDWRNLLPLAAGTGRDHEGERATIVLDWLFGTVLPILQTLANKHGFGDAWTTMTTTRTPDAANAAANAAADAAYYAANAANAAYDAANAANAASYAASYAANAASYAYDAANAANAAYDAYDAYDAAYAARTAFWQVVNPAECLARLVAVSI